MQPAFIAEFRALSIGQASISGPEIIQDSKRNFEPRRPAFDVRPSAASAMLGFGLCIRTTLEDLCLAPDPDRPSAFFAAANACASAFVKCAVPGGAADV